jgi:hypothetical protein
MPYIGKQPTVGNFQVCDAISVVDGQAAYTMQVGGSNVEPENANHMLVSLNGILQKPGSSFTISGSTITFASNLATGDVIDFITLLGDTLNTGAPSDDTVKTASIQANAVTSAKMFSGFANGITEADQFRYTAETGGISGDITSNIERVDTVFDKIGTGMTLSSGVFTFPSTGIYLVQLQAHINFSNEADNGALISTLVTSDNSSYTERARAVAGSNSTSGNSQFTVFSNIMVDVTDTSNVKVKFNAASFDSQSYLEGHTDRNQTSFTFIRLGDT